MLSTEQKSSLLYKHYLGTGSTRINREFFEEGIKSSFVVRLDQIWAYSEMIPNGNTISGGLEAIEKIKSLKNDEYFTWNKSESEKDYKIVKRYIDFQLSKVDDGTDTSFLILDNNGNQIKNIIPYNYYEDVYLYSLKTQNGDEIAFGVGDWVVDIYSGVVTFYGEVPENVSHDKPPLLSFYQYVGAIGNRNDVNGFEAAVLPLTNIKIDKDVSVITKNTDTNESLYSLISKKANEIEDNFTKTYGFDGADKNEGIALSFQKILPLMYTSTKDTVKGYDSSENSNIGTLLSSKTGTIISPKVECIFVSQLLNGSIEIDIPVGKINQIKKIPIGNDFILIKYAEDVTTSEKTNIIIVDSISTSNPEIFMALMYWDSIELQYLPFINKEETHYDFGFPVVAAQGKIPPSLILDTSSLTQYADQITPDYYGPRVVTGVIANHNGNNIKSSDYIVKNIEGWFLEDKIAELTAKYFNNLNGKILLRSGEYEINNPDKFAKELEKWKNVIIEGESNVIIKVKEFTINSDLLENFTLSNIEFPVTSRINLYNDCNFFINNIISKSCDFLFSGEGHLILTSSSFKSVITGSGATGSKKELLIKDCIFGVGNIQHDNVLLSSNTLNDLYISHKNVLVGNCFVGTLHSKTEDIFIESSVISNYDTANIPEENLNQLPIGTNKTNTSGRFPIFAKDDFKHLKYSEFAHPFNYDNKNNIIELLYDKGTLSITDDGKLKVTAKADALFMPNVTYERGDNATDDGITYLQPKKYTTDNTVSDVLKDLWKEKADLNEKGKIPLQQLPDSVAYGGLQFVGMWSFERSHGLYPEFSDVNLDLSTDKEVDSLQPGWFFIVDKSEDRTDDDNENDNPVAEQKAIDNVIFTAGDWVICNSSKANKSGFGWTKVDRAYSDPTFSPLPNKAMPTGEENKAWYWKNHRKGGALDLSNRTIISAFSDVNKELKKLQPKKPSAIFDTKLIIEDEDKIPTITYRQLTSNLIINQELITKFDLNKRTYITIKTVDENPLYKNLIYFGDSGNVSVTLDDIKKLENLNIKTSSDNYDKDGISIFIKDSMLDANHGENYWKGFSGRFFIEDIKEGKHIFKLSVDNILIDGEDATQDKDYAGSTIKKFEFVKPFVQDNLEIESFSYFTDRIETLMNNDICSGIRGLKLSELKSFTNISGTIKKVYKDGIIPKDKIIDLRAIINNDENNILCNRINVDKYVLFTEGRDFTYQSIKLNAELPITHDDNIILTKNDTINIIATVYDVYGNGTDIEILTLNGVLRADKTTEPERVTHGLIQNNSEFDQDHFDANKFGFKYPSLKKLTVDNHNSLLKIGRVYNGTHVSEYRYPSGKYINDIDYDNFEGEKILGKQYAIVCFSFSNNGKFLDEACGFSFKINTIEDVTEKLEYNKSNGQTNKILLQCCIVDTFGNKVTDWLDCNKANNGFLIPKKFGDPAMYAGLSTSTKKRITFGKTTYTGDLYIRIGIEENSGIAFTGIEIEEII